jgi:hypothetical protein
MAIDYYGIDTETYNQGGLGLKSIQIYGEKEQKYIAITTDIAHVPDEEIRYKLLDELFEFFESRENDTVFYFFNLTFDFSQMEKYFVERYEQRDGFRLKKGECNIMQSPNRMYSVRFRTKTGGRMIYFYDIWLLTNSSLNASAKAFVGDSKIFIDDKNFEKGVPSPTEQKYAMKDAEITYKLALALKDIHGFDLTEKITIGARSLAIFDEVVKADRDGVIIAGAVCPIFGGPAKSIQDYFEIKPKDIKIFEKMLRRSTRGGICQAFQTGIFKKCVHIDIHSAHPSQMVKSIPYGPMLTEKPDGSYDAVVYPDGVFTLKPGGLKMMTFTSKANCLRYQYITENQPGIFVEDFALDGSYGIWQDEFDLIISQYDFAGSVKEYYFKSRVDSRLSALIKTLYHGKESSVGARRDVYKYLLNALYGKFLTRPDGEKIGYVVEDGKVTRRKEKDDTRKPVALPLGSWIATQTRVQLISTALKVRNYNKNLLYCDTDSLIFKYYDGWEEDVPIGDNLGEWGIESMPEKVNVVGPKTYQEVIDGVTKTKCAGLSHNVSDLIPFGELKEGYVTSRLKAERDPDTLAISLNERPFTVSTKPQLYKGGH